MNTKIQPKNLHKVKIRDLGRVVTGKTPPTKNQEYYGDKYPFITPTDISDSSIFVDAPERYLSEEGAIKVASSKLPADSVCYTCIASVGKIVITTEASFTNQQINSIIVDREKADYRYVFYLLKNITLEIKGMVGGAASPIINKSAFENIDVDVLDLQAQKGVADILFTYDDLIENNTKRIKILEEIAQAIYKEWFVYFRFPGYEKIKRIDSKTEFGKIPEGWKIVRIGDIADFMNGYAFKPKHLGSEGLPVIKIPELRSGILDKTPRNSGEFIPKKYLIKTGDILFSWSATLLVNIWNSGDALLNQHLFKVTPKESYLYSFVFYLLINQIEKYRTHAVGATMQHLRKDVVESANALLPDKDLLIKFEGIVARILKERSVLMIQNQNLRQARDLLLPKLITGELTISN